VTENLIRVGAFDALEERVRSAPNSILGLTVSCHPLQPYEEEIRAKESSERAARFSCSDQRGLGLRKLRQHLQDMFGKRIGYLSVSRNRLTDPRDRILVPVVVAAPPHQHTTPRLKEPNEVGALHLMLSSPTLWTREISPEETSL
jgi:hypothetical protein